MRSISLTSNMGKMKMRVPIYGVICVWIGMLSVACNKEAESSGIHDGELLRFTVGTSEIETRTYYGDKNSINHTQAIKWEGGEELHLIVYDPSDYSQRQYSIYVVTKTEEDGRKAVIAPRSDQVPLVYHENQSKVVAYYMPGDAGNWYINPNDVSGSKKGSLWYNLYQDQFENYLDFDYPEYLTSTEWFIPTNMRLAYMCAEPTSVTQSGVVSLHFVPMFTAFEVKINNPSSFERFVNYVCIWNDTDQTPVATQVKINDLTDPIRQLQNGNNYNWYHECCGDGWVQTPEYTEDSYLMEIPANGSNSLILFCDPYLLYGLSIEVKCDGFHGDYSWDKYDPNGPKTIDKALAFSQSSNWDLTGGRKKYFITLTLPAF